MSYERRPKVEENLPDPEPRSVNIAQVFKNTDRNVLIYHLNSLYPGPLGEFLFRTADRVFAHPASVAIRPFFPPYPRILVLSLF